MPPRHHIPQEDLLLQPPSQTAGVLPTRYHDEEDKKMKFEDYPEEDTEKVTSDQGEDEDLNQEQCSKI